MAPSRGRQSEIRPESRAVTAADNLWREIGVSTKAVIRQNSGRLPSLLETWYGDYFGEGQLAYRPIGSVPCIATCRSQTREGRTGFYEAVRDRTIPQGFTTLVSVLYFRLKAYDVSSLADKNPKKEILVCLEQRSRDAILVGQPESNIPPRDRGWLPMVS